MSERGRERERRHGCLLIEVLPILFCPRRRRKEKKEKERMTTKNFKSVIKRRLSSVKLQPETK